MSDDWPHGWYQNEKPFAGEPTRDAPIQAAPDAFGSTGFGNGGYGNRGYGNGGTAGGWPTQPPANAGQGNGYGRPGPGPGSGSGGNSYGPGGAGTRRRRRWLRPKRILLVLAALLLVLVVAVGFLYVTINGKLNRANVLTAYSGRPAPTAGTNWLIAGSDSRGGLSGAQENQFALGHNVTGGRSDTIMILHIPANGPRRRLSASRATPTCRFPATA